MTPSGIRPTEYNVLIKPKPVEEKTKGGLIIPDSKRDLDKFAQEEGEIVAVAQHAFSYETWPDGSQPPQLGDMVLFAKYAGTMVSGRDGVEYRLVKDKDIAAVLENDQ